MEAQNNYYNLSIYFGSSLFLTLGILYLLIPIGDLELHDWPTVIILVFIVWYTIYLLLVVGKIFVWDKIF